MSPLTRSLLALACAALLHVSSAVNPQGRARAANPDVNVYIVTLESGILHDPHAKKNEMTPFEVHPKNKTDFSFIVPNSAKQHEALIGQSLAVVGKHKEITLKLVYPGKHSPVLVHCSPRCEDGIIVYPDQVVIPIIL